MSVESRPQLILAAEQVIPCGYAPRALLESQFNGEKNRERVFVGCKDGSVTMVERGKGKEFKLYRQATPGSRAVRALRELDDERLLVGRSDGAVEIVRRDAKPFALLPRSSDPEDSVRYIKKLHGDRWLVSWRTRTNVFTWDAARERFQEKNSDRMLPRGIRLAVPYEDPSKSWLLVTSRGEIWILDSPEGTASRKENLWPPGENPGFVDDLTVIRKDLNGSVQQLILATDLGVYSIEHKNSKRGKLLWTPSRLSLPGVGAVCMALTRTSTEVYDFLWAADARGDSHLFWRKHEAFESQFRPCGIVHVGSQVMLANAWSSAGTLVFAQARRNDAVAFSEYVLRENVCRPTSDSSRINKLGHYRQRLLYGTVDELRTELEKEEKGRPGCAKWPTYAILSDYFEFLASRDNVSSRALREFLTNPSARVALDILDGLTSCENFKEEVKVAVRLWVLTLLGIVNRIPDAGEALYLGVIRWLKDLEAQAPSRTLKDMLDPEVQKAIRFARKWGLFGKANSQRVHLTEPLNIIDSQLDAQGPNGSRTKQSEAIDLLTYRTLLFARSHDVLHKDERGSMRGRSAWDLGTLEVNGRWLIAVSWMWGGVELYEMLREPNGAFELDLQLAFNPVPRSSSAAVLQGIHVERFSRGDRREPSPAWQIKHGYSRAILLGSAFGCFFLLTAQTLENRSCPESLHLWRLEGRRRRINSPDSPDQHVELREEESVYCFLEVEEGLILAGLRGRGGCPTLALLKIQVDAGHLTLAIEEYLSFDSSSAGTETNRVWSLARAVPRDRVQGGALSKHRIAVGCESGEIFRFTLEGGRPRNVERVAQLSSPVISLAYLTGYDSSQGMLDRIFAGAEDGSIVAWQKEVSADSAGFASLWSTVEEGPVEAVHPVTYGGPMSSQAPEPLVLAVTRTGHCAVFDDRPEVAPATFDQNHPQRPFFPGKRLRRSKLGGTAFASRLLLELPGKEAVWKAATGRYAALITASEQGRIRLVSLHYPQSPDRKAEYYGICQLWWTIVLGEDSRDRTYDRLRLADAVYQASPLLPLILVRWLLDPKSGDRDTAPLPDRESLTWAMPRYLRGLVDFREEWDKARQREGSVADEAAVRSAAALERLLLHAWQLEDIALFQHICALTLKRTNYAIFEVATTSSSTVEDIGLWGLYRRVFDVIERALQRWLGAPDRRETRARIAVAKSLIDGDTFLCVLRRAATENNEKGPFHLILEKRIEGVRQLIFKNDPLVSLETFRALNLSLMRLCRRLIDSRDSEGRREEVSWPAFSGYFEALTYAAARTFHSRLELNDSLSHEYCRTFALAVCACPSAAVRIANRMTETQLISDPNSEQDLSRRVIRQFALLGQIGIPVPRHAEELFTITSCPPEQELNPVERWLTEAGYPGGVERPDDANAERDFGRENTRDLYCLCRLYEVVDYFVHLEKSFSTDAKEIDLSGRRLDKLAERLEHPDIKSRYRHSKMFWGNAISKLKRGLASLGIESPSKAIIRPEVILASRKVELWARQELRKLEKLYRDLEIFQPEYPIFREVLARLERAARAFPGSAAVQRNLVVAVFDHHLLEELDEHVFELEELAQNLDPLMVWRFRKEDRVLSSVKARDQPVAQRFAEYLLRRASHAERIPKNLRALHGTLEAPHGGGPKEPRSETKPSRYPLKQLFEGLGWKLDGRPVNVRVDEKVFQFLSLAVNELESNNREHSGLTSEERRAKYVPRYQCLNRSPFEIEIRFQFKLVGDNFGRLERLKDIHLQEPFEPRTERDAVSTGTGLYLANYAASVVSWCLQLRDVFMEGGLGTLTFKLLQRFS